MSGMLFRIILIVLIALSFSPLDSAPVTAAPTVLPTESPTIDPSASPSVDPTIAPSSPTVDPTVVPTAPSPIPTEIPTVDPTFTPTEVPTASPSTIPTLQPTGDPTLTPTENPTAIPTTIPSTEPTLIPTTNPTARPTKTPTRKPTRAPTLQPTASPSVLPTFVPTAIPTTPPAPGDPKLISYTLNCGIGKLALTFDLEISAKTVDLAGITLQTVYNKETTDPDVQNFRNVTYTLQNSYNNLAKQGNTSSLVIYLSADDIADIYLTPPICQKDRTYLTLLRDSLFSPFGYANKEVNRTHAMAPLTFTEDVFPPYVASFSLYMDTGRMHLTFTEPIDLSSFTLDGLTIQSRSYLGDGTNDPIIEAQTYDLVDMGASLLALSDKQRSLVYQLGDFNMNRIKSILGLAVDRETTFLSAWKPFVNDTTGNSVSRQGFDKLHALRASHYRPDLTPPTLLHWDFDRNNALVTLTFSETVYRDFFNYSRVIFTNASSAAAPAVTSLRVENPVNLTRTTSNTDVITFILNEDQFNLVKAAPTLLTLPRTNSFLILEYNAVVDTSAGQNVYQGTDATPLNPMPIRAFTSDHIDPQLVSFVLDMDSRLLTLTFTETVCLSSISIRELTLQSERSIGVTTEVLRLRPSLASLISTVESPVVVLSLTTTAFSLLKSKIDLAKSAATTYLSMTRNFVTDRAGNATHPANKVEEVPTSNARMALVYLPDRSAPLLESWRIDLTTGQVELTFSKPVNTASLRPELMTLHSDPILLPSSASLLLSDSSYVLSEDINIVVVKLSEDDTKQIKLLAAESLCVSAASCYLSLPTGFVNDTSAVTLSGDIVSAPLLPVMFLEASVFTPDSIPPVLLNYSMDLTTRSLTFTYDEPVFPGDVNASALTLEYTAEGVTSSVQISSYSVALYTEVSTQVVLQLTRQDIINIQEASPLATSLSTLNLTVADSFAADVAGNSFILSTTASNGNFPPFALEPDRLAPRLISVYLQAKSDDANITLYFSELVDVAAIKQQYIFLASSSGATVELTNAVHLTSSAVSRSVEYSITPLFSQLSNLGLAKTQSTTHLYISGPNAVVDVSEEQTALVSMSISAAIRDGLAITSFRLNMAERTLALEMAFPSDVNSVDPTKLTLYSADLSRNYRLQGMESYYVDRRGPFLVIALLDDDLKAIRFTFTITASQDIILMAGVTTVVDSNNKQLSAAATLTCSHFIPDSTALTVTSYELDLSVGTLRLYFSKEAETATVDLVDVLALHSTAIGGDTVPLTNLSVIDEPNLFGYVAPNVTTLLLSLNNGAPLTTRENVLLAYPLASTLANTFLSVRKGMIYDLARPRNPVESIAVTSSGDTLLPATVLTLDTTPPEFLTFDLNLNTRLLTLHFSEAVDMTTMKVDYLTFLQTPSVATSTQYVLSTSEVVSANGSVAVIIALSELDVNNMMAQAPNLLLSPATTHISMRAGAVYDLAVPANPVPVTLFRYGVPVQAYVGDTTAPRMLWYNMSVQTGDVVMYFDELVVCATVQPSLMMFQATAFNGGKKTLFRLSNVSRVDCSYGPKYNNFVYVSIDPDDLIDLKSFSNLAKTTGNTFLRLLPSAVKDVFGNSNIEMRDGTAMSPTLFIPDTSAPQLLSFLVNQQKQLSLFFNEPVDPRTNTVREVYFQNLYTSPTHSYPMILSTLFRASGSKMKLDFEISKDYKFIAAVQKEVLVAQSSSFLRVASVAFQDLSGNALLERGRDNSLQLGPAVISWDLDINTGILKLVYSEAVNSSFSLLGFAIQGGYADSSGQLVFTTTGQMTSLGGSALSIRLNNYDLNSLKLHSLLTDLSSAVYDITAGPGSAPNLFLTADYGLTASTNAGDIIPYLDAVEVRSTNALRIKRLVKDTTPPVCLHFSVDLNLGLLLLTFDEPTQADSLLLSQLVLSSSVSGKFINLGDSDRAVSLVNMTQLCVNLSRSDLNEIKRAIATSASLSILDSLVMFSGAVTDLSGNAFIGNNADNPIQVSTFVTDTTPPVLQSWTLNRYTRKLKLYFSEYVHYDFVQPTSLVLLSTSDYLTAPERLQLTNYSKVYQGSIAENEVLVDLDLFRQDAFALEAASAAGLGTSVSDTYLAITALRDIFGNIQNTIQVVQATSVKADTTPLLLQAFDWEHESSDVDVLITAYFSKVVDVSTFACEDFEIRSLAVVDTFQLASTDCTLTTGQVNSHIVQFIVPYAIFSASSIDAVQESIVLGVPTEGTTADLSGNLLALIRTDRPLRMGPQLLKYHIDVNLGLVVYDFSRPLNYSIAFNASDFGFYSALTGRSYFLQSSSTDKALLHLELLPRFPVSPLNSTIGALFLDDLDLTNLKLLDILGNKLYALVVEGATLTDLAGRGLVEKYRWQKLTVSNIILDDVAPSVVSAAIDMSTETLTIMFDEPIRESTVDITHFCLQGTVSLATRPASYYCLTDSTVAMEVSTLTVTLSTTDAAAIKLTDGLAKNISTTFLSFEFETAQDMAGNQLPVVTTSAALAFSALEADITAPRLDAFIFDVSNPEQTLVHLIFSEPVDAAAINFTDIAVQSRFASRDGVSYQLTGGSIVSTSLFTVVIALLANDITAMKLIPGLIRSKQSTYLSVNAGMTVDLAGNALLPYLDGAALSCQEFLRDKSPPEILQSIFNANDGTLTFVFNEPVLLATVDVTALTIQLSAAMGGQSLVSFGNNDARYSLTTMSTVSFASTLSKTMIIILAQNDLDELKGRFPLLSSQEHTWFSFTPLFVEDTSQNSITQVRATAPVQATDFILDTTRPTIRTYTLDMNALMVSLLFSESIKTSTVQLSELTVQSIETKRFGAHIVLNKSSFTVGTGAGSNLLKVRIGEDSAAYMKLHGIGAAQSQSYLSWTDNFIADNSENYLSPLWDSSVLGFTPRTPDVIQLDTTAPILKRWFLHRQSTSISAYFFFDEPVHLLSLVDVAVYFTDRKASTGRPVTFGTLPMTLASTLALFSPTVTYSNSNRNIVVHLTNYCTDHTETSQNDACLGSTTSTQNLFAFLNQTVTENRGYFLSMVAGAFSDYALASNPSKTITERNAMAEGNTDCTTCIGNSQYVSNNCTATMDKHCSACTVCPVGSYIHTPCGKYQDTACAACSTCGYGNYIASNCSASKNTECAPCTICPSMQYASRLCERGLNTICNTCKLCTFVDSAVRKVCERDKGYYPWQQANCCVGPKGEKVACERTDRSEILQASIDGRHHWSFASTSPHIDSVRNPSIRFPNPF